MKNSQRAELLEAIAALCQRYPHWRLGQLVANIAGWADQDVWDVDDERLLQAAQLHLEQANHSANLHATTQDQAQKNAAPST
jgi:hypothetical protein